LLRAGDRELVLRRPPIGAKIKTAHDMSREYRILSHLHPVYQKVPRPLLFCDDESILGAPFYVMERVTGNHPARAAARRDRSFTGADAIVFLKRSSTTSLRFTRSITKQRDSAISDRRKATSSARSKVGPGVITTPAPMTFRRSSNSLTWLHQNLPADSERAALIHNDYKYDNLVLAPDDLRASSPCSIGKWRRLAIR
jgi:aminoglycoside phosphotransferase (APT) family kinase protein